MRRPKNTVIKIDGQPDLWAGQHIFTARVGKLNSQRVSYISIGEDRTMVVGIHTLDKMIDLLVRQRERLAEAILADVPVELR